MYIFPGSISRCLHGQSYELDHSCYFYRSCDMFDWVTTDSLHKRLLSQQAFCICIISIRLCCQTICTDNGFTTQYVHGCCILLGWAHLHCANMLWRNFCPHLTGQNNVDTSLKSIVNYFY